jgi:hypothetical protein
MPEKGSWVRVQIDWEAARIEPNGASVYFFPKAGGEPYILLTNHTLDSLYIPTGDYSVLVFNERTSEHTNIAFRGVDVYETFEAYTLSETSPPDFMRQQAATSDISAEVPEKTKASGRTAAAPDVLAVARLDQFYVTGRRIPGSVNPLLKFTPRRVTVEMHLRVRITDAQYLAQGGGGSGGNLSGMAGSVMLATGLPPAVPVTQYFSFQRVDFDEGSTTDGVIQTTFSAFGPVGMPLPDPVAGRSEENTNLLWMQFLLRDGSIYEPDREFDVTEHFDRIDNTWTVQLNLDIGFGRREGDDPITLPYAKEDEGMFNAEVNPWKGNEVIDSMM